MTTMPFSGGVELDQLLGHILDVFLNAGLLFRPGFPAETIYLGQGAIAPGVLLHGVDLGDGNIHDIVAGILDDHVIAGSALHPTKSCVSPDAVVDVNDIVAHFQIAELGNRLPGFESTALASHIVAAEHFPFTENRQFFIVGGKTGLQSTNGYAQVKGVFARSITLLFEQLKKSAALARIYTKQLDGVALKFPVLQLSPEVATMSGPSSNGLHGCLEPGGLVDIGVADLGDVDLLEFRKLLSRGIPRQMMGAAFELLCKLLSGLLQSKGLVQDDDRVLGEVVR